MYEYILEEGRCEDVSLVGPLCPVDTWFVCVPIPHIQIAIKTCKYSSHFPARLEALRLISSIQSYQIPGIDITEKEALKQLNPIQLYNEWTSNDKAIRRVQSICSLSRKFYQGFTITVW